MTTTSFADLGVPSDLVRVLAGLDITTPTPIQAATLPDSLAGRDVLGRGRTGSGKTFAFLLPLVARLAGGRPAASTRPRALVLVPTRELAQQVQESLVPLAEAGLRPVRALQRISAINLGRDDATTLEVEPGTAGLRIERTSYLADGRVAEFTRSLYRGDAYNFVAELRLARD